MIVQGAEKDAVQFTPSSCQENEQLQGAVWAEAPVEVIVISLFLDPGEVHLQG
jgi:hypothetical protein